MDNAWTNQFIAGGNGDGTLFYPGSPLKIGGNDVLFVKCLLLIWIVNDHVGTTHIPIESIRMKQIRDGLEDMEMFRSLVNPLFLVNSCVMMTTADLTDYWKNRVEADSQYWS